MQSVICVRGAGVGKAHIHTPGAQQSPSEPQRSRMPRPPDDRRRWRGPIKGWSHERY